MWQLTVKTAASLELNEISEVWVKIRYGLSLIAMSFDRYKSAPRAYNLRAGIA